MIGLPDTSYKGIKEQYKKILEENKKISNTEFSTGGFLDKTNEKRYLAGVDTWRTYIVNNKKNNKNVESLNMMTLKCKGDIRKAPVSFQNKIKSDYHNITKLFGELKNNTKKPEYENITLYSFLSLYQECVDFLTDPKYVSAFSKAYAEFEKNKNKPKQTDATNIFVMIHQILVYYISFCTGLINRELDLSPIFSGNYTGDEYVDNVEYIQKSKYKSFMSTIGITVIQTLGILKTLKNPAAEVDKCIKTQKEGIEKIKSAESFDAIGRGKIYNELSQESYLVDRTFEPSRGQEEAITIALIVAGSILGFFVLIFLIRRCIYFIGTFTTDFMGYLMIDEETISMNIESLKEKLENTTDPKEIKKLKSIIEKQEKWLAKFKSITDKATQESDQVVYEATAIVEEEDREIEKESSSSDSYATDTGGDDFKIML